MDLYFTYRFIRSKKTILTTAIKVSKTSAVHVYAYVSVCLFV